MTTRRKRANYSLDARTLGDLRYVQQAGRIVAKTTAVEWCIQLAEKLLRVAASGRVVLVLDPKTGSVSPVDLPGQSLDSALDAVVVRASGASRGAADAEAAPGAGERAAL